MAIPDSPFLMLKATRTDYNPAAQSLAITNGRLLVSKELANALGRPSDAGAIVGKISVGAAMQPIQIDQLVNGETKSMVMPPMPHAIGPVAQTWCLARMSLLENVQDVDQMGSVGTQFGFAVGTDSCNNGDQPIDWFALPEPIIRSFHKIFIG